MAIFVAYALSFAIGLLVVSLIVSGYAAYKLMDMRLQDAKERIQDYKDFYATGVSDFKDAFKKGFESKYGYFEDPMEGNKENSTKDEELRDGDMAQEDPEYKQLVEDLMVAEQQRQW